MLWSKKAKTALKPEPPANAGAEPIVQEQNGANPSATLMPPSATAEACAAAPMPEVQSAQSAQSEALSSEEAQRRALASKQLLMSLGEIVSVMMRSPQFRTMTLAEIEALVVPGLMAGQFLVAEAQSKDSGFITPVGMALWARVSAEVDRRLTANLDQPLKLAHNEWASGDIPWLIALSGDPRVITPMIKKLQETKLGGRALKVRTKGQDGRPMLGAFGAQTGAN